MSHQAALTTVYGAPPTSLVETPPGAVQVSPRSPGAGRLEDLDEGSLAEVVMVAPAGTIERRYALALALRRLRPGARLTVLAPNDKGGTRLRKELESFGCAVDQTSKRHHRICTCRRPELLLGIAEALSAGAPRLLDSLRLWTQPGIFSWDRVDPGSALLVKVLPTFSGRGADLGCGIGHLARAVLHSRSVECLTLIDNDRRAVEAAIRNVDDPRAHHQWADVTAMSMGEAPSNLDFVVTNPPFHDGGVEDRELGLIFIRQAATYLQKGGALWLVANRHLPYEAELAGLFTHVDLKVEEAGFKVFEARR